MYTLSTQRLFARSGHGLHHQKLAQAVKITEQKSMTQFRSFHQQPQQNQKPHEKIKGPKSEEVLKVSQESRDQNFDQFYKVLDNLRKEPQVKQPIEEKPIQKEFNVAEFQSLVSSVKGAMTDLPKQKEDKGKLEEALIQRIEDVLSTFETPEETQSRREREAKELHEFRQKLAAIRAGRTPDEYNFSDFADTSSSFDGSKQRKMSSASILMKDLSEQHKKADLQKAQKLEEIKKAKEHKKKLLEEAKIQRERLKREKKLLPPNERVEKAKYALGKFLGILKLSRYLRTKGKGDSETPDLLSDADKKKIDEAFYLNIMKEHGRESIEEIQLEDLLFSKRKEWETEILRNNFMRILSLERMIDSWMDRDMPPDEENEKGTKSFEETLLPLLSGPINFNTELREAIAREKRFEEELLASEGETEEETLARMKQQEEEQKARIQEEEMNEKETKSSEEEKKAKDEAEKKEVLKIDGKLAAEHWHTLSFEEQEVLYQEHVGPFLYHQMLDFLEKHPTLESRDELLKKEASDEVTDELNINFEKAFFEKFSIPEKEYPMDKHFSKMPLAGKYWSSFSKLQKKINDRIQSKLLHLQSKWDKSYHTKKHHLLTLTSPDAQRQLQSLENMKVNMDLMQAQIMETLRLEESKAQYNIQMAIAKHKIRLFSSRIASDAVEHWVDELYSDLQLNKVIQIRDIARLARSWAKQRVWMGETKGGDDWFYISSVRAAAKRDEVEGLENQHPPMGVALKSEVETELHENSLEIGKMIDEIDIYEDRYVDVVTGEARKSLRPYFHGEFETLYYAYYEKCGTLLRRLDRAFKMAHFLPHNTDYVPTFQEQEEIIVRERNERMKNIDAMATEWDEAVAKKIERNQDRYFDEPLENRNRTFQYYSKMLSGELSHDEVLLEALNKLKSDFEEDYKEIEKSFAPQEEVQRIRDQLEEFKRVSEENLVEELFHEAVQKIQAKIGRPLDQLEADHIRKEVQEVRKQDLEKANQIDPLLLEEQLAREREEEEDIILKTFLKQKQPEGVQKQRKVPTIKLGQKVKKRYLTIAKYQQLEKRGLLMSQIKGQANLKEKEEQLIEATAEDKALIFGDQAEEEDSQFKGEETEKRRREPGLKFGKAAEKDRSSFFGTVRDSLVSIADKIGAKFSPGAHANDVITEFMARRPGFSLSVFENDMTGKMVKMVNAFIYANEVEMIEMGFPDELLQTAMDLSAARQLARRELVFELLGSTNAHNHFAFISEDGVPILGFRAKFQVTLYDNDPEEIYDFEYNERLPKEILVKVYISCTETGELLMTDEWLPPGRNALEINIIGAEKQVNEQVVLEEHDDGENIEENLKKRKQQRDEERTEQNQNPTENNRTEKE